MEWRKFGTSIWCPLQLRMQDFPLGGTDPLRGAPTSDGGKNICENERIGSRLGGGAAAPRGSANALLWKVWDIYSLCTAFHE